MGHIESLRAIAALMVLCFHLLSFEGINGKLIENDLIREYSKFGAQGVELFYLISGFVIYFSLSRINFTIQMYPKYLLKRFLRIFPPFWGVVLLICLMALIWKGIYPYSFGQILQNATLTVDLFGTSEWLNPIFATLKVEFLFYLLIGFLAVFMRKNTYVYAVICFLALGSVYFFHSIDIIHNIPFFILGIASSEIYQSKNKELNYSLVVASLLLLSFAFPLEDLIVALSGVCLILWIKIRGRWIEWIGQFSYSLYLTHGLTIGLFLLFFKNDKYVNLNSWIAFLISFIAALGCAFLYYLVIEKRAIRWSKGVKY